MARYDFQAVSAFDIWLIDLERGAQMRFTTDPAGDGYPAWSPDGNRIAFVSIRNGFGNLYQKSSNGSGTEESLLASRELKREPDWSPDGRFILYSQLNATTNEDLFLLPLSGERKPEPFLQTNFIEAHGRFSPNGRWVAYISNETGKFEVYVQSFPAKGDKIPISTEGGGQPQWRADGRELYYYTPGRKLMAVEVGRGGLDLQGRHRSTTVRNPRQRYRRRARLSRQRILYSGARRQTLSRRRDARSPQSVSRSSSC